MTYPSAGSYVVMTTRWHGAPGAPGREKGWQDVPDDLSSASNPSNADAVSAENGQGAVAAAVRELLEGVRAGEAVRAGGLTLIPLLPAREDVKRQTGYLPLEEALRRGLFTVTEQAQATVPELTATSTAETPVVLVGGEQVIGGLQNRVLNTTILVPAHAAQAIPVTCVEAGRWHEARAFYDYGSPTPGTSQEQVGDNIGQTATNVGQNPTPRQPIKGRAFTSDEAAYASLRRMHAKSVTASLSSGGGYHSDQGAVWNEVSARMASTGSFSPSSAMDTLYKTPERANRLAETMAALKRPEGALGFVATVDDHVLGAELFADEALADAYWEKLARSYAVEAMDTALPGTPKDEGDEAANPGEERLLAEALAADIQVHPSPGLGEDARLAGSHVSGAGLVYDGAVVHLSLFPEDTDAEAGQTERHYGGHRQSTL